MPNRKDEAQEVNTSYPWPEYPKFQKIWNASAPEPPTIITGLVELAEAVVKKRPLWGVVFDGTRYNSGQIYQARFILDTATLGSVVVRSPGSYHKQYTISSVRTSESMERKFERGTDNPKRAVQIILKDFRPFSGVEVLERSAQNCVLEISNTANYHMRRADNDLSKAFQLVVKHHTPEQVMKLLAGFDSSDAVKAASTNFHKLRAQEADTRAVLHKDEGAIVCVVNGVYFVQYWTSKTNGWTIAPTRYTEASLPEWIAFRLGILKLEKTGGLSIISGMGGVMYTDDGPIFYVSRNKDE